MNCQDITRLIDSGKFSTLSTSERRDAEAHALGCRHCAPLWIMHAGVAATRVPVMPAVLSVRCLTLAAAGSRAPSTHRVSRVMVVVGALVVLAAAASMLMVNVANAPSPRHEGVAGFIPPATPVAVALPPDISAPPAEPAASPEPEEMPDANAVMRDLRKFPPPVDADKAFVARQKQALEKLVELHPELVNGPPIDDMFVAAILLRADGKVLDHTLRMATRATLRTANEEVRKILPTDGGESVGDFAAKGTQVAEGRSLRGNLSFHHLTVRNSYDPSRSNLRVDELMRAQRAELMLPTSDAGFNYVTVLLSDGGKIQREIVEFMGKADVSQRMNLNATERARDVARRLGISVEQIGRLGYAPIMDSASKRGMYVDYAWQRLPGESAPEYPQGDDSVDQEGIDVDAALALVERVMPDAFMNVEVERALGQPVILLTEDGQFIRSARFKPSKNPDTDLKKLFPGLSMASLRTVILKNGKGATSAVMFIWQGSSAPK